MVLTKFCPYKSDLEDSWEIDFIEKGKNPSNFKYLEIAQLVYLCERPNLAKFFLRIKFSLFSKNAGVARNTTRQAATDDIWRFGYSQNTA